MSNKLSKNYSVASLVSKIQNEIESAKNKLQNTADLLKTISYWNIGKHISDHMSAYKDQTEYGKRLFPKLAEALHIGERSLYHSYQFFNSYPDISSIADRLSWGHYKILLTVKSEKDRAKYTNFLLKNKLSTRQFFAYVKNEIGFGASHKGRILPVVHGTPFIYKLKKLNDKLHLDLGFHTFYKQLNDWKGKYDESALIRVKKDRRYSFQKVKLDESFLYTYKAYIDSIIDGNTITLNIDLGFGMFTKQKLRFNGISASELYTDAGTKAKKYAASRLSGLDFVVAKTYRINRYYRYAADIFYSNKYRDIDTVISKGSFLNQELLDNGLVKRYYLV